MNKHIGVRYVCEDSDRSNGTKALEIEENILTPAAFATLPIEWIADLQQAISQGYLELIAASEFPE